MACGTFYLTQHIEGLSECFKPGTHLDTFRTVEEMKDKIEYYLTNPEKREEIARTGKEHVLKYFDAKPLVENLLKVIETKQKNYSWDDIYLN
jgi:spore maturation protein CgeB